MRLMPKLGALTLGALLIAQGIVVGLCASSEVRAAEGPDLIPDSAAAVIYMKAPKTTLKDAAAFVDDIQPGFGQMVQGQAGMLGIGISNPTMQGVDQGRDWYAAVFLRKNADPTVAFVIPALNPKAMQEAVDDNFEFIATEDYGIYSEDAETMKLISAHLESSTSKSIGALASEKMKALVADSHFAVAINLEKVKSIYQDELLQLRDQIAEGVEEAQGQMTEVPGVNLEWIPGLVETVLDYARVAVEEAEGYALSLTLAKSGVRVEEFVEFTASGEASRFLAKYPTEQIKTLAQLPPRQLAYGAFSSSLGQLNVMGMDIVPKMLKLDDEQKAQWAEAKKTMQQMRFGSAGSSFTLGDLEEGLLRGVTLTQVAPTDKYRELTQQVTAATSGLEVPGVRQEMTYEQNFEEIDGVKVDLLVTTTISDDDQFGGLQEQMNQILYGGDAMEVRIAYLDGATLQTVGGGQAAMKAALQAYKGSTGATDTVLARDTAPLGATNNIVGLIDLPTLLVNGLKIAAASPFLPPLPFDEDSLGEMNIERSYIGVTVATGKDGVGGMLHIPKDTLKASFKLFSFFQQIQAQQNAF